jgi:hypothetical protein
MTTTTVWRVEHQVTGAGPFQAAHTCHYAWTDCDCDGLHLDVYKTGALTWARLVEDYDTDHRAQFVAGCLSHADLRTWFSYDEVEALSSDYQLVAYEVAEAFVHADGTHRQVAVFAPELVRVTTLPVRDVYPLGYDPADEH